MPKNENKIDTSSKEYKTKCLAIHLLRKPLGKRRVMLGNMEKLHGVEAINALKEEMKIEHKRIQTEKEEAKQKLKEILKK